MAFGKIALIGSSDFFRKTLYDLFIDHDFEVKLLDIGFSELESVDVVNYNLIIVRADFASSGGEKAFFDFLLSANSFILVDDGEKPPAQSISRKMSLEEILLKVGNTIFTAGGAKGVPVRSSPRIQVNLDVQYVLGDKRYRSTINLLSNNGAFIASLTPPPKDSVLKLYFSLSEGGAVIEATARVLYSIGYNLESGIISRTGAGDKKAIASPGMAVFFEEMKESGKEAVTAYVDRNATYPK